MLSFTVTRPPRTRRPLHDRLTLAESCTPETMFGRLIEETEELRRLCGFDSELFHAADQLTRGRA